MAKNGTLRGARGNGLFRDWASAPYGTILGHFVESGQTQAPRSSTRHNLRVCIASSGPRGPPGKVPVGTGEIPFPAGTDPGEHVCLPKAFYMHIL